MFISLTSCLISLFSNQYIFYFCIWRLVVNMNRLLDDLIAKEIVGENWGQDMKWMIIKRVQDDINRFTDYPKCCYTEGMSCHLIPTFLYGLKGKIISTCSFNLPFSIFLESLSFCTHVQMLLWYSHWLYLSCKM